MAPGVVVEVPSAAVTEVRPSSVSADSAGRADSRRCTLVYVRTLASVSHKTVPTGTVKATQHINTHCIGVTIIVSVTFIDVYTSQSIPCETIPTGAPV